jgi:ferredoxin
MTKTIWAAATACFVFLAFTPMAKAVDMPSDGVAMSTIVTWLQGHGYQAVIKRDDTANSDYVSATLNGVSWTIYFYECAGGDQGCHQCADTCTAKAIQYAAGWNAPNIGLDKINAWDRDKRYLRSYSDTSGAVWAEYDVKMIPGDVSEQLDMTLATWNEGLAEFRKYIGQ